MQQLDLKNLKYLKYLKYQKSPNNNQKKNPNKSYDIILVEIAVEKSHLFPRSYGNTIEIILLQRVCT